MLLRRLRYAFAASALRPCSVPRYNREECPRVVGRSIGYLTQFHPNAARNVQLTRPICSSNSTDYIGDGDRVCGRFMHNSALALEEDDDDDEDGMGFQAALEESTLEEIEPVTTDVLKTHGVEKVVVCSFMFIYITGERQEEKEPFVRKIPATCDYRLLPCFQQNKKELNKQTNERVSL